MAAAALASISCALLPARLISQSVYLAITRMHRMAITRVATDRSRLPWSLRFIVQISEGFGGDELAGLALPPTIDGHVIARLVGQLHRHRRGRLPVDHGLGSPDLNRLSR
jgi:hypothetical protein